MANTLKSLVIIHNNPFTLAPLLTSFYRAYGERDKSLLLSYLVLPLVLNPTSGKVLANARSNTTLATFVAQRERIFGLQERLDYYRSLSNSCIQYAVDSGALIISSELSVVPGQKELSPEVAPYRSLPASKKLGEIFSPFDIPAVYRMLGIKKL